MMPCLKKKKHDNVHIHDECEEEIDFSTLSPF